MTDKNTKAKTTKPTELSTPVTTEECPPNKKLPCCSRSKISLFLLLIIAIAALLIALYSTQNNYTLQKQLVDSIDQLTIELSTLTKEQSSIEENVASKANLIQQAHHELQNEMRQLDKAVQETRSQRLYQTDDWQLLKARYYLELAQVNTQWSSNNQTTVELLQQADTLLALFNDPKIVQIRKTIAKEISQVQSIPVVDVVGLLSQLDALQTGVANLYIQAPVIEPIEIASAHQTPEPADWKSRLKDSINSLQKLVVIRRSDEAVKPLMSPIFESIFRESIRLNLQEAQWAILNNNQDVFQQALQQAITNLKKGFNETSPNTTMLLIQLTKLQKIQLTSEKPTIGLALPLLNQMINDKTSKPNQLNEGTKGGN